MKNITITLDEALARRVRVEATARGKSLSKFIAELVEREVHLDEASQFEALERFLSGPGYPGVARDLLTRGGLYAERDDELRRR
jgi:hypothetical protein